jgi:hypothetical protein
MRTDRQGMKVNMVSVFGFERQQLRLLRRELGLLPDGAQDVVELKTRRLAA